MDIFLQKKALLWTIALLLLLNVASLGMLWYQNSLHPTPQRGQLPRGPEAVARMIDRELNLSDDQMQKLDQLRREHFHEVSKIQYALHTAKRAILQQVSAPASDTAKVRRLVRDVGENQAQFEQFLFDHFLQIKSMLTAGQKEKFEQLLHEVTDASGPPELQRQGPAGRRPFPNPEGGPPPDDMPEHRNPN